MMAPYLIGIRRKSHAQPHLLPILHHYRYNRGRVTMLHTLAAVSSSLMLAALLISASPARGETAKEASPAKTGTMAAGQPDGGAVPAELIRRGEALFTGAEHFSKRGAPCVACHALRYPGVRGGNWGPDLTEMYTTLSGEGLAAVLQSPPYAGMKKMYEERPMSEDEIKALVAFAKDAAERKAEAAPHYFPWAGIAFFGVMLGFFSLYKRRVK